MPGLLRGVARVAVVAGTATAVSNRVSRRQAGRWSEQEQAPEQGYEQAPKAEADGDSHDMDNKLAQLQRLGELKSQGVLTEDELQQQKSQILGS